MLMKFYRDGKDVISDERNMLLEAVTNDGKTRHISFQSKDGEVLVFEDKDYRKRKSCIMIYEHEEDYVKDLIKDKEIIGRNKNWIIKYVNDSFKPKIAI